MKLTAPPYNADIGPGGPDMNAKAGFPRVRTSMKEKMSPFFTQGGELQPGQMGQQQQGPAGEQTGIGGPRAPGVAIGARSQGNRQAGQLVARQLAQEVAQKRARF